MSALRLKSGRLEQHGLSWPFNIHDDQPDISSKRLRPTIHVNFAGPDFLICGFVPGKVNC
ncbi:MAG: hypothetical protein JSV78_14895 [Phycisphaerales bacterium]|nr:MAG: hypothetical protein JSV78_14895 [Phycisphaerales bacterium]